MLLQAMFFIWFIWPCIGSAIVWLLVRRFHFYGRWAGSLLFGISPTTLLSWPIYKSESGGSDPDPMSFLKSSTGIAAAISIVTIAVFEIVKARK